MNRLVPLILLATLAAPVIGELPASAAASCESLAGLKLADTTIKSATAVNAGPFTPPGAVPSVAPLNLPAFCRVVGVTPPAVVFEVWLPAENWNGKFQGVGNGGTAGVVSYAAMATALNRGYATASTDTGHVNKGPFDSTWALGHPELVEDFGHRALHLTTVNGKEITRAFYAKPPDRSYYVGCSKGGQQGLMEAQRYPEDYDGIIAGDPAHDWTRFYAGAHLWYSMAMFKDPESYIPAVKIGVLDKAVAAACDAIDGLVDGLIDDPRKCQFDPSELTCKVGQDPGSCFTPKQVKAIKDMWSGVRNSAGQLIFPGLVPGAEASATGWIPWTIGTAPFTANHWRAADGWFKYAVFQNPDWDFRTFNFDTDLVSALQRTSSAVDAVDPNLLPLKNRGAKLITYHGWSDPDISPLSAIDYYESVVSHLSGGRNRVEALADTQDFFRLFMVPGMTHCAGGPGPNSFDMLTALEQWVERGIAPQKIIATHLTNGVPDRTRPLCPYPQVARWNGTGSTDDATNFSCVNAER